MRLLVRLALLQALPAVLLLACGSTGGAAVTDIRPAAATPGRLLLVSGQGLGGIASGTLGGQALTGVTAVNDRLVAVTVPAGTPPGEQPLVLTDAAGTKLTRTVWVTAPGEEAAARRSAASPSPVPTPTTPARAARATATPTPTPTPVDEPSRRWWWWPWPVPTEPAVPAPSPRTPVVRQATPTPTSARGQARQEGWSERRWPWQNSESGGSTGNGTGNGNANSRNR